MTAVLHSTFIGDDTDTETVETTGRHTLVFNNAAQIDTAQFKFGASSLLLDGTTDYVSAPDSADFNLAGGQFTLAAWVRAANWAQDSTFLSQWNTTGNLRSWAFFRTAVQNLSFAISSDGTAATVPLVFSLTPAVDTWIHVAIDRDALDVMRMYVGGVMVDSATDATVFFDSSADMTIGALGDFTFDHAGHIGEVYINKGEALWGSDGGFTVPTAPLFVAAGGAVPNVDTPEYRSLLLGI